LRFTSDEILGFTAFGAEASELLAPSRPPWSPASLHGAVYAHPTMAEGLTFLLRNTPVPA
jgi:hypothetical protein